MQTQRMEEGRECGRGTIYNAKGERREGEKEWQGEREGKERKGERRGRGGRGGREGKGWRRIY